MRDIVVNNVKKNSIISLALSIVLFITLVFSFDISVFATYTNTVGAFKYNGLSIPSYDGDASEVINNNEPLFTDEEINRGTEIAFEEYGELDKLGRCTAAMASLDVSLKPDWKRGKINMIKPTGWNQNFYECLKRNGDGHIYERCHLIADMFTGVDGENGKKEFAERNLITGTGYLNSGNDGKGGMLKYENIVRDYINRYPDYHVLYRVTPVFTGNDLVAKGVLMEAESLENEDVKFCVFCYNVQQNIRIDYATGQTAYDFPKVCDVSIPRSTYVYTGKQIKPSVNVKGNYTDILSNDYKVQYGTNKSVGQGSVTVSGLDRYAGSTKLKFKIIPKGTTITKLKKGKSQIYVKWKKHTVQTTGYQLQYSLKKDFKTRKTITVKNNKCVSKTIKKLKRNKKYYLRIRTYKKGGYYSSWSKTKHIRTK